MSQKYCPNCKTEKEISEFGPNKTRTDGVQSQCKKCRAGYNKLWYAENTETQRNRVKSSKNRTHAEYRAKIQAYLREHPCIDCGNSDIEVLEFDHRDRSAKEFAIGDIIRMGIGWNRILTEIEKCDVRCANCHRKKTRRQLGWWVDEEAA